MTLTATAPTAHADYKSICAEANTTIDDIIETLENAGIGHLDGHDLLTGHLVGAPVVASWEEEVCGLHIYVDHNGFDDSDWIGTGNFETIDVVGRIAEIKMTHNGDIDFVTVTSAYPGDETIIAGDRIFTNAKVGFDPNTIITAR